MLVSHDRPTSLLKAAEYVVRLVGEKNVLTDVTDVAFTLQEWIGQLEKAAADFEKKDVKPGWGMISSGGICVVRIPTGIMSDSPAYQVLVHVAELNDHGEDYIFDRDKVEFDESVSEDDRQPPESLEG